MRVDIGTETVSLRLTADDTREWSRRPRASWPCSFLAGKRLLAIFDGGGLCDLAINNGRGNQDCPADEFNAITSDFLRAGKLPTEHPAWFAAVGQFEDRP